MIYSVYSYGARKYDYYETSEVGTTHAGAPPRPVFRSEIGATPEAGGWQLPMGAKKIGSGEMPRGRIASRASAMGLGDLSEDLPRYGVIAGVVYLAWRLLR